MSDATFQKVRQTDKPMYGPRKLLLCGFSGQAQTFFYTVLEKAGLAPIEVVWADDSQLKKSCSELLALSDNTGRGQTSPLPRAIIVSGITEKQLHTLMSVCRASGMKNALWAALTPTSERWPLGQLLIELQAEREAISRQGRR